MNNSVFFQQNGYVLIKKSISSDIADLATQYALFDEMQDFSPDGVQVPAAHSKYADPLMESLLLYVQPIIEKNTGLKVLPTYSFYRVYRNGDELLPHKDRPACEISTTLCLNYSYSNPDFNWPIYIDDQAYYLEPTDMIIYRGLEKIHWREKLITNENDWHAQVFLHYVDANGPHVEWENDKRKSIGHLKTNPNVKKSYIEYL